MEVVTDNLDKAQIQEINSMFWYNKNAKQPKLEIGDQVLVQLPTESSQVLAQLHGQ